MCTHVFCLSSSDFHSSSFQSITPPPTRHVFLNLWRFFHHFLLYSWCHSIFSQDLHLCSWQLWCVINVQLWGCAALCTYAAYCPLLFSDFVAVGIIGTFQSESLKNNKSLDHFPEFSSLLLPLRLCLVLVWCPQTSDNVCFQFPLTVAQGLLFLWWYKTDNLRVHLVCSMQSNYSNFMGSS